MTELDQADYEFLLNNAQVGKSLNLPCFIHLDQPIGILNYIRIANDIVQQTTPGRLLDWGAGYGQMTYLLQRRGFKVTPFDIGSPEQEMPAVPLTHVLPTFVRSQHSTNLPFGDASFDIVLGCGVLEHVDEFSQPGNEMKSLSELKRVLKPDGLLFIYQLPQCYAWQEAIIRRFKLGYAHPRRYTATEITKMLIDTGYQVQRIRRANLIPKNLTGMPQKLRSLYNNFSRPLIAVDAIFTRVPILNEIAGVMEIKAQRIR
jgi:SAM-dependent methyltransferase